MSACFSKRMERGRPFLLRSSPYKAWQGSMHGRASIFIWRQYTEKNILVSGRPMWLSIVALFVLDVTLVHQKSSLHVNSM